jgi:hypothetical protein
MLVIYQKRKEKDFYMIKKRLETYYICSFIVFAIFCAHDVLFAMKAGSEDKQKFELAQKAFEDDRAQGNLTKVKALRTFKKFITENPNNQFVQIYNASGLSVAQQTAKQSPATSDKNAFNTALQQYENDRSQGNLTKVKALRTFKKFITENPNNASVKDFLSKNPTYAPAAPLPPAARPPTEEVKVPVPPAAKAEKPEDLEKLILALIDDTVISPGVITEKSADLVHKIQKYVDNPTAIPDTLVLVENTSKKRNYQNVGKDLKAANDAIIKLAQLPAKDQERLKPVGDAIIETRKRADDVLSDHEEKDPKQPLKS